MAGTDDILQRYTSPVDVADASGTPFVHDPRNPIAQWLSPRGTGVPATDSAYWPQRMGLPAESDEYWAAADGSPWKRSAGQNALMRAAESLNTPTGFVLSNFMGPAMGRLPRPVMAAEGSGSAPKGIRAYHGSPHDFDKFDMSKIGTGEGAQAFGHGLYFAEAEGVAKQYRDKLSPRNAAEAAAQDLAESHGRTWSDMGAYERQSYIDEAGKLGLTSEKRPKGRLYEVSINADPARFIDYDKPFAQQTPEVRDAVSKALFQHANKQGDIDWHIAEWMSGGGKDMQEPMQLMQFRAADRNAASKALADAGIPGVKYKDAGSRGAEGGTSNYVVFDDNLIEILRKYGLAGLLAGGAGLAADQSPATASSILDRYTSAPKSWAE